MSLARFLINGKEDTTISLLDRGLQYGDGLFETLLVRAGLPLLWDRHWDRLVQGCIRLDLAIPSQKQYVKEAQYLCKGVEQAVLKLMVTRGVGGRGYRPGLSQTCSRILGLYPAPNYPKSFYHEGIVLRLCRTRLGLNPGLAGLKHLNRLEQVLARAEWDDSKIPEGLMQDVQGRVIEGTMSNVFLVRGGSLHTPKLNQCGVAGIQRALILELATREGIQTFEAELQLQDVIAADELFVCNSLIGLWPVQRFENRSYPYGDTTQKLANLLCKV